MLKLLGLSVFGAQVYLERPPEELQQDLEACLGDGRIVPAFAQLVANKSVLRPSVVPKVSVPVHRARYIQQIGGA